MGVGFCFVVSETGLPYVSLAGLELRDAPPLPPNAGIKGLHHYLKAHNFVFKIIIIYDAFPEKMLGLMFGFNVME